MYKIYIVECKDNSLYTGITSNIKARMRAHFYKLPSGAKYTRSHKISKIKAVFETFEKSDALRLEAHIKRLKSSQKRMLCEDPDSLFCENFPSSKFSALSDITLESCLLCEENEYPKIEKLFKGFTHPLLSSFFKGSLSGLAFSDNPINPKSACVVINNICFFAGKRHKEFLKHFSSAEQIFYAP